MIMIPRLKTMLDFLLYKHNNINSRMNREYELEVLLTERELITKINEI